LAEGGAKFRQDDDWAVNWGSTDFPSGIGADGGDNIPVSPAGDYMITFDKSTGAYNFEQIITLASVGIIGDATPGGWDDDTDMIQSSSDPNVWTGSLTLTDGGAKFRANDDWEINWGGSDFPMGTAMADGDTIPITAGDYLITLNTETGEYNFQEIVEYSTVGLIGDATPGGWDNDTDMMKDPDNGEMWSLRVILMDGEAKFRAENDWAVNWGAGDFPSGTASIGGANIPITAGEYIISFNSITGEYHFEAIVVFSTVGLIGTGSPTMGWDVDTDLVQDAANEHLWTGAEMDLFDGEVKFRAEDDWAVNWGLESWPAGIGEQDGANIPSVGGTYAVSINTLTGEYGFVDPTSTQDLLDPGNIKVYPNPTSSMINIDLTALEFNGAVKLTVLDITGKVHKVITVNSTNLPALDVSDLTSGNYFLQISNEKFLIGKRFSVNK